jgi:DNA-binding CsgD family transcriptional regulator
MYQIGAGGHLAVTRTASVEIPERFVSLLSRIPAGLPPSYVRGTFGRYPCSLASQAGGKRERALTQRHMTTHGESEWRDVFVLNGRDPTDRGLWIGVPLERRLDLPADVLACWTMVAVHLAASLRLRERLAGATLSLERAEAVIEPRGAIAHARGPATTKEARRALSESVRALEKLRTGSYKRSRARPLDAWKGLVNARWTLVDQFESDGRRFLIAECNDVPSRDVSRLTDRERQVVAFASLGHTNKLIAYELGISQSTVAVFLHRAARRLRVATRGELIAKFLSSSSRAPQS